ncbi:putative LRR receptor-like serine/threonine-protein kinase [Acorus calamus]|uniref:non-specific serine/threonine protein kinase n=1 Tax=Acorus calamus TaxID=4465 RepID=A0AAV9D643_ACOCL|nr:putative LRR receptor-like serine/threonine-protein kinase [Acorus calamus]
MSEDATVLPHRFFLRIFIFISSLFFIGNFITGDDSLETDRKALLDLKQFLERSNKINQGNYGQWGKSDNKSPCNWAGIACENERVVSIDLSNSSISGRIYPNFSSLTALTHLNLSQNTIGGSIPPGLNSCANLKYLNLSHNIIEGGLNLSGLGQLEVLDVTLNRFSGDIRPNFPLMCANLVSLNLSMNNFTGDISDCFKGCPKLKNLDLSSNDFTGTIWPGFMRLNEFSVSENNLTGLITSTMFTSSAACELKLLDLSGNAFSGGFPDEVQNCSELEFLNLGGNNFSGGIPRGIGKLSKLMYLILGNNSFDRDIPEELLACANLAFLDLSTNRFGGEVQPILGRFTQVKFLVLHHNYYTDGIISSQILNLTNVIRLDLSFNNFSGGLPIEIADMPSLKYLILANNSFTGPIPPEFGKIVGLQALDLSFNGLTGEIPPSIGNLTSLLWLMLANNGLTGRIPPEIGNCKSLLWLNLANNALTGPVPPEIAGIGSEPETTFDMNRRNGLASAGSGECLTMKRWLPANYPPFSFVYTLMTRKSCRDTWDRLIQGYGLFPICQNRSSAFQSLEISGYIQLTGNRLSGEIPPEIGNMTRISLLHLGFNNFSGRFQPAIANLPLVVLNASNNAFSGQIPPEIGGIKCLQALDLSNNNFSGEFPGELNKLSDLNKFNLSCNPLLTGVIPATGQLATFDRTVLPRRPPDRPLQRTAEFLGDISIIIVVWDRQKIGAADDGVLDLPLVDPLLLHLRRLLLLVLPPLPVRTGRFASRKLQIHGINADDHFIFLGMLDLPLFTGEDWTDDVLLRRSNGDTRVPPRQENGLHIRRHSHGDEELLRRHDRRPRRIRGRVPRAPPGRATRGGEEAAAGRLGRGEGVPGGDGGVERRRRGVAAPEPGDLYGWCLFGSEKLLVYEFMEGGSLEDMVADWRRFGWRWRAEVAVGVAKALAFLHHECKPAVVHRDVKASNVLLDREGKAKVTDLGLARMVDAGESHVSTIVAGTVGYVAPEYGQTWRATTKGDVYSYGVLVMELATGRRAVDEEGECLVDWARRVGRTGWRGVRMAVEESGVVGEEREVEEMCEVLRVGMRCTVDVPQVRPSMKEVLDMLGKIFGGDGGDR